MGCGLVPRLFARLPWGLREDGEVPVPEAFDGSPAICLAIPMYKRCFRFIGPLCGEYSHPRTSTSTMGFSSSKSSQCCCIACAPVLDVEFPSVLLGS